MSLSSDIRTALLAMDAVTALVGTGDAARIRPDRLDDRDDKTLPHIVIEIDGAASLTALDGTDGLIFAEVNISCRAITRAQADALALAVKYNGTTPGTGLAPYGGSGTAFDAVLDDAVNSMTPWGENSQRAWYTVEQSYTMSYSDV